MKRATCFFCYSWDNSDKYEYLEYIKKSIEESCDFQIDVILDKKSYKNNDDFDEKLQKMRTYDLIVVFFTPELKSIITDSELSKDREVLKEYEIVLERYKQNPSAIYPVILSGSDKTALTHEFSRRNAPYVNALGFTRTAAKKLVIQRNLKPVFNNFVFGIINYTRHNFANKSIEYATTRIALNKLFSLTDTTELPDSCLIKTDIYADILNQEYYFVAGRKGSGKSTFINNFRGMDKVKFDNMYKQMVPVKSEAFQHEDAYGTFIKKHEKDLEIMTPYDWLTIFWKVYFTLQSILIIGLEVENGTIDYKDERRPVFEKVTKILKRRLGLKIGQRYRSFRGDNVPKTLFHAVVELVDEQFDFAISQAVNKQIIASFSSRMTSDLIIERFFGQKNISAFLEALRQCKKKIIISLDGFDTHSEDFREATVSMSKDTDEFNRRTEYEKLFYRTLIEVVNGFKQHDFNDRVMSVMSNYLDFCIVLPKDRYDQIIRKDRDSFKKRFCALTWDAYELLNLLVRRLEYLIKIIDPTVSIDTNANLFTRMDNALSFFPGLPQEIIFDVKGNKMTMGLFNYILRFSFWRPRDVISNLSSLLAYVIEIDEEDESKITVYDNVRLSNDELKLTIKDNVRRIIQEEFIEEYQNVFRNLEDVLGEFRDSQLIIKAHDFRKKLGTIRFDASYAYSVDDVDNKMQVLYELGIIGLKYKKDIATQHGYLHHICYIFNAGIGPFKDFIKANNKEIEEASIIFNPILSNAFLFEFNTSELIGNWSQEYIERLHKMKRTIQTL